MGGVRRHCLVLMLLATTSDEDDATDAAVPVSVFADVLRASTTFGDPSLVHELPKRVFAPLGDRGLTLCDYIFHGDAACDSLEALQELLGLDVSAGDIELDTEHSPESNQQVIDGVETAEIITEATEQLSRGRNMLIPIASAAIAALGAGISYLLLQD
ncbi:hypothetical protein HPB49_005123 [Dermacentor silvarum]|uniref:Uncharacterized protein n=1 Tax=Dermacentor silvarum TaxID=543639 RepID=A0ACB8DVD4_DERSI|nr:hypothetical protein HPB49_005123 [Dermacentor silvarum]